MSDGVSPVWAFTFGKHKGKTIQEVGDCDPNYIVWAFRNVEWFRRAMRKGADSGTMKLWLKCAEKGINNRDAEAWRDCASNSPNDDIFGGVE